MRRARFSWVVMCLILVAAALVVSRIGGQPVLAANLAASSFDGSGTFLFGGQPAFPIALSNPPPIQGRTPEGGDALAAVVNAGITVFRVGPMPLWQPTAIPSIEAWDLAALEHNVHTWVSLGDLTTASPGSTADSLLQKVVSAVTSDPSGAGIGFWKGADEPAWGGPTPTELRFAYCRVTSRGSPRWCAGEAPLDPGHLWLTVEAPRGSAAKLAGYSHVTDTHGVDVYPISIADKGPDLHQVGVWTRTLASITPDHSVWTTLQICSSGSYSRSGFLLPTPAQERYMIYDAIINGARGLAFFGGDNPACWNASDHRYGWNWTFWTSVLKGLIHEVNADSPLAAALDNPASTRELHTSDPGTEAIGRIAITPTGKKQLWVIAARASSGSGPVTITGLPQADRWAGVYTENRPLRLGKGTLTDRFSQWQAHVYELPLAD